MIIAWFLRCFDSEYFVFLLRMTSAKTVLLLIFETLVGLRKTFMFLGKGINKRMVSVLAIMPKREMKWSLWRSIAFTLVFADGVPWKCLSLLGLATKRKPHFSRVPEKCLTFFGIRNKQVSDKWFYKNHKTERCLWRRRDLKEFWLIINI